MTDLEQRGGVCMCGAADTLVLVFGGRNKRQYDLDGEELR